MSNQRTWVIGLSMLLTILLAAPAVAQRNDDPPPMEEQSEDAKQKKRERADARNKRDGNKGSQANQRKRGSQGGQDISPDQRLQRLVQLFKRLDADGDGVLKKSEAPRRMQQRWDQIDENGDGQLDRPEIGRLIGQMRERTEQMTGDRKPGQPGTPPGDNARAKRGKRNGQQRNQDQTAAAGTGSVEPIHPGKKNGPASQPDE